MSTGNERARVDVLGGVLCVLGLGGPVFALIEEPQRGWGDPLILVSLVGGVVLFALFVLWESRAAQPMLPLRLFSRRNFSFANLETLTVYAGLATLTFFLVLFLQQLAGYTALRSGLALLPITIVMFLLSPRVGRLSMRYGPRWFMGVGPLRRRAGLDRSRAAEARLLVLVGAPPRAARLLRRPLDDRRTAHRDGAGRRG